MANRGRVVVPDLAAPERIQPSPLKSDIYGPPRQEPINNTYEQLASALGILGKAVTANAARSNAEREKAEKEAMLARWEQYQTATTDDQRLADMREGKHPWFQDPLIQDAFSSELGRLSARDLASRVQGDIRAGKLNPLAPDTDIPRALTEYAAPEAEQLLRSRGYRAVHSFRTGVKALEGELVRQQSEHLNRQAMEGMRDSYAQHVRDAFITGARAPGATPESIVENVRVAQFALGPRKLKNGKLGGVYDIPYGEGDKIFLDVAEQLAADPNLAAAVVKSLYVPRRAIDGTDQQLPALAETAAHFQRVQRIEETARKTIEKRNETAVRDMFLDADLAALKRGDSSFAALPEHLQVPLGDYAGAGTADLKKSERQKEAINRFLQESIREAAQKPPGSPEPTEEQIAAKAFEIQSQVFLRNGIKNPAWTEFLDGVYKGSGATTGGNPEQFAQIAKGYTLFTSIADRNYNYVSEHLDKEALKFYQGIDALVRYRGMALPQAAAAVSAAHSNLTQNPHVEAQKQQEIRDAVSGMDFSWMPFSGGITNKTPIYEKVVETANAIAKYTGLGAKESIQAAQQLVTDRAVYVNGHAIFGAPGITKADVPAIEKALGAVYDQNKAYFKESGIGSSSGLSLMPYRNGQFLVINSTTGTPQLDSKTFAPLVLTMDHLDALRDAKAKRAAEEFRQSVLGRRFPEPRSIPDPGAEHRKPAPAQLRGAFPEPMDNP